MALTPKIVFVGTFPPTEDGIATFNADLLNGMQKILGDSASCVVAAINMTDTSPYYFEGNVLYEIDQDTKETYDNVAELINNDESVLCVILQHEYGIFGGTWGEYVTDFVEQINKPLITVMHSVLETHEHKPDIFKSVTNSIIDSSDSLIVLSKKSKEILKTAYPNSSEKVSYIPHGIHAVNFESTKKTKQKLNVSNKTILTTFGLLSRDKGIEYVIESLPEIINNHPDVLYLILGQTHPNIRKNEGEVYRTSLVSKVKKLGLKKHVRFVDKYLPLDEILMYLKATDLYIATSVNKDQAVSGTFSYAIGTGRAVVSTSFVQSNEVVKSTMGRLVTPRSPKEYSQAINDMLSDKKRLYRYHKNAYTNTRDMLWTNVAKEYIGIIETLINKTISLPKISIKHLKKLTGEYGLLQFAKYDIPTHEYGYTLDDNARALIVTNWMLQENFHKRRARKLLNKYFSFALNAQQNDGTVVNYYNKDNQVTKQNDDERPEEHLGRTMWALAETIVNKSLSRNSKKRAIEVWENAFPHTKHFIHLRPRAFLIKACAILHKSGIRQHNLEETITECADLLVKEYKKSNTRSWQWYDEKIAYNNAIIPESLALAYELTRQNEYIRIAKKTMKFLVNKTFMGNVYVPIGHENWYEKGKSRSYYDQQPEDVAATVLGLLSLYEVTKKKKYIRYARSAFTWFLGNNLKGIPLYNYRTGGVYDGLQKDGVNKNQGGESLVSYLLSRIKIDKYFILKQ